tara:strand:+ start:69 stop:641 length:573 start_codon:yes stop_codon:yes gene_type:complete
MPTLDDTTTLQKTVAVAANDYLVISNTDAGGGSRIQQVPAALAVEGFTHAWVINYDNAELAAQSGSGTAEAITLLSFASDQFLKKARVMVTEAFTSSGSMSALSIDLGESGDSGDDNLVDAVNGLTINMEENTGASLYSSVGGLSTEPAGTLELTLDPTGVALNTLTAGQVVVLVSLTTITDYKDIVPAT